MASSGCGRSIVIFGVSGSGKSLIGSALARRLGLEFIDADWLHSASSVAKMRSGIALDDNERMPWLHTVGQRIRAESLERCGSVAACSALKRGYRDVLRHYVPDIFFVLLEGPESLIRARIGTRQHEFMPLSLLALQLSTLEKLQADEGGLSVDVRAKPDEIVDRIVAALGTSSSPD